MLSSFFLPRDAMHMRGTIAVARCRPRGMSASATAEFLVIASICP